MWCHYFISSFSISHLFCSGLGGFILKCFIAQSNPESPADVDFKFLRFK